MKDKEDEKDIITKKRISYIFVFGGAVVIFCMCCLSFINIVFLVYCGLPAPFVYIFYIVENHFVAANIISRKLIVKTEIILTLSIIILISAMYLIGYFR